MEETRLQKYLAQAGIGSRRACEKLIEDGLIKVNGEVASIGDKVIASDVIEYNGKQVTSEEQKVYYMLFKPVGVVTTASDEKGRKNVVDMIDSPYRIYPVGRLDINTSGLLILTNDGKLANGLMHPSFEVEKTYKAVVDGDVSRRALQELSDGVMLDDGKTFPATAELIKNEDGKSLISIVIHEGRNRQVRRMIEAVGYRVLNLRRIKLGELDLKGLKKGEFRELTIEEIDYLYSLINTEKIN